MSNQLPEGKPRILVLEGLYSDTVDIIDAAGGDGYESHPWDIAEVDRLLDAGRFDGLVLTGGSDIDPRLYNEKPHKEVYGVDQLRDTCEWLALDHAISQGIPVLGICRGSQIMCAYRGGKLTQHIEGHRGGDHPVTATPDCQTFKRAIGGREMDVISLHHQCVRRPGRGMRIAARAYDNTPEAIESKDGLWLGVQFHPEMAAWSNGNAFAVFQWLVRKAAEHAGVRPNVPNFRDVRPPARRTWVPGSGSVVHTLTDDEWEAYTGTSCATPKSESKHRQAGTRSFASEGTEYVKSAAESAEVFEGTCEAIEHAIELHICPDCAMLFDFKQDRDDHVKYIHRGEPFPDVAERYPELLPPPGHEAWDDEREDSSELTPEEISRAL